MGLFKKREPEIVYRDRVVYYPKKLYILAEFPDFNELRKGVGADLLVKTPDGPKAVHTSPVVNAVYWPRPCECAIETEHSFYYTEGAQECIDEAYCGSYIR